VSKRGFAPLSIFFPLSFQERGIQGVRLILSIYLQPAGTIQPEYCLKAYLVNITGKTIPG